MPTTVTRGATPDRDFSAAMAAHRILILGGTGDARRLAARLAERDDAQVTLSLAGRTVEPIAQGVPVISGGFGGAAGLADHLRRERVSLLVDATHPYAARMAHNAAEAAGLAGLPLVALRRPGWVAIDGDRWTIVPDTAAAVAALGAAPRSVFLALGRNEIAAFEAARQHRYLVRSVDPVEPPLALPDVHSILERGPFREADEAELLQRERIETVVCKNSGGDATYGKIAAARGLGIEVVMIARPALPDVPSAPDIDGVLALVGQRLASAEKRGV